MHEDEGNGDGDGVKRVVGMGDGGVEELHG